MIGPRGPLGVVRERLTSERRCSLCFVDCSPACGISGSVERRRRTCAGKQCPGREIEERPCLSCSSPMLSSNWSCWTDWSECSSCRPTSKKSRTRTCLSSSCSGESREERLCSSCSSSWLESLTAVRFTLLHLLAVSLLSLLAGGSSLLCCRRRQRSYRQASNTFLHQHDDRDYFQASTSNASSSPHTGPDVDTFTTLSTTNTHQTNKFRSFDSSSSSTTGGQSGVSAFLKEIPSRKLNMYINPREMPPLPPAATLKRTSLMSSMKTNLDADDL